MNSAGPRPSASAAMTNSSASRGARHERLHAVEHPVLALAARRRREPHRVEQRPGLEQRERRRGRVLAEVNAGR